MVTELEIESVYTFEHGEKPDEGVVVARKLDPRVRIEGEVTLQGCHAFEIEERGALVKFRLADVRDAGRFNPGQRIQLEE